MGWLYNRKRLAKFIESSQEEYWQQHWHNVTTSDLIEGTKNEKTLLDVFTRYLPSRGKILEAGCGPGHWTYVLRQMKYDVQGVDFEYHTIAKVRDFDSRIPVCVADVVALPYPANYFDAYISLGVMEHFAAGPQEPLREARRTLRTGGIITVSVPFFSPLRKMKALLGYYNRKATGVFNQYAFTENEIVTLVERIGFEMKDIVVYGGIRGLIEDIACLRRLARSTRKNQNPGSMKQTHYKRKHIIPMRSIVKTFMESSIMRRLCGHMILVVARVEKPGYQENP